MWGFVSMLWLTTSLFLSLFCLFPFLFCPFSLYSFPPFGAPTTFMQNPSDVVYRFVELRVLTNWGHVEYTCLYRFRVHGQISSKWGSLTTPKVHLQCRYFKNKVKLNLVVWGVFRAKSTQKKHLLLNSVIPVCQLVLLWFGLDWIHFRVFCAQFKVHT